MQNVCKFFKPSAVLLGSLWSAYLIGFQHNEKYLDFFRRKKKQIFSLVLWKQAN